MASPPLAATIFPTNEALVETGQNENGLGLTRGFRGSGVARLMIVIALDQGVILSIDNGTEVVASSARWRQVEAQASTRGVR